MNLGRLQLIKLKSKNSAETSRAIIKALSIYRVETITYDNGLEFARHEEVSAMNQLEFMLLPKSLKRMARSNFL